VFLAGVSLRYVVNSLADEPLSAMLYRLAGRALTIYFAQIVITAFAIAIIAGAAKALDQPYILQWHNAAAVFEDPVDAHIGLALLRYQLGYFNILPLYVVLMASAPTIAIVDRLGSWLVLALSAALYVYTLTTGWNLRTWPVEGNWYFSPFAWQFIFVLGFVLSAQRGYPSWPPLLKKILFALAGVQVLVGAAATLANYSPDPALLPSPKLFFVFDKTFLSPARLIHALALICFFLGAFKYLDRFGPRATAFLAMLGRNSLNVFCAGSILSLCGQIARYRFNGRLEIDVIVLLVGLTGMGVVAWLSEWRTRLAVARAQRLASA
ncbi:MAG TPA: OpgC domain-containing protein, partial [Rhodoblastus sp.]|nr:OpgC domain-containing protein [Rhodoblastus sp.]